MSPMHASLQHMHIASLTTDVIECNPRHASHIILASYQLQKEHGNRIGAMYGFNVCSYAETCENSNASSHLVPTFTTNTDFGIFDIKYSFQQDLFIAAGSGKVALYETKENAEAAPECLAEHHVENEQVMCCSADWNNRLDANLEPHIFSSTSSGELLDLQLTKSRGLTCVSSWQGHDYEAWIVACNHHEPNVIYSGGDDMKFKGWDLRALDMGHTFSLSTHEAGVCSIQKHPSEEHTLVTGSYDNHIYLWDTRLMRRPVDSLNTDGGVWRLKWHPKNPKYLLAACMRASFQIVRVDNGALSLECLAEIEDGENLAYGCDWIYAEAEECKDSLDSFHFASCSFYDKEMQWWKVERGRTEGEGKS